MKKIVILLLAVMLIIIFIGCTTSNEFRKVDEYAEGDRNYALYQFTAKKDYGECYFVYKYPYIPSENAFILFKCGEIDLQTRLYKGDTVTLRIHQKAPKLEYLKIVFVE